MEVKKTIQKITEVIRWMVIIFLPLIIISCVGGQGKAKVEVAELGFLMELPSGWQADKQNPRIFFEPAKRDDNFGMVEDYPLEGQSLDEYIEAQGISKKSIISKTPQKISGLEAIELVTEGVYSVIEVNIRKGDTVIRVSFRTLKEDFAKYEPSLRKALHSIEVR